VYNDNNDNSPDNVVSNNDDIYNNNLDNDRSDNNECNIRGDFRCSNRTNAVGVTGIIR
jgi:hypothetical protein